MTKWKWMLAARLSGKSFHPERKRRLLLARSRAPGSDPPFRPVSRRAHRHRRRPRTGAAGAVPLHIAVPDLVRSNYPSPEKTTNTMKAVYVEKLGGPENLIYGDMPKPQPGPGQALVKIAAAGVNFIDMYFRIGLYPADSAVVLGNEGAGTVEAVGPDVTDVQPWRPRRLCDGARLLCRICGGARVAVGEDSGSRRFPHCRGSDAARHDGALPDPLHLSAESRRLVPDSCRGGRYGTAAGADGQDAGRARGRQPSAPKRRRDKPRKPAPTK